MKNLYLLLTVVGLTMSTANYFSLPNDPPPTCADRLKQARKDIRQLKIDKNKLTSDKNRLIRDKNTLTRLLATCRGNNGGGGSTPPPYNSTTPCPCNCNALQNDLATSERNRRDCDRNLQDIQNSLTRVENDLHRVEGDLTGCQTSVTNLNDALNNCRAVTEGQQQTIIELRDELDILGFQLEQANRVIEDQELQIDTLKADTARLNKLVIDLDNAKQHLIQTFNKRTTQIFAQKSGSDEWLAVEENELLKYKKIAKLKLIVSICMPNQGANPGEITLSIKRKGDLDEKLIGVNSFQIEGFEDQDPNKNIVYYKFPVLITTHTGNRYQRWRRLRKRLPDERNELILEKGSKYEFTIKFLTDVFTITKKFETKK